MPTFEVQTSTQDSYRTKPEIIEVDDMDDDDYEMLFSFRMWCDIEMETIEVSNASDYSLVMVCEKPAEIWEIIYRLMKRLSGMIDPVMVKGKWQLIFTP